MSFQDGLGIGVLLGMFISCILLYAGIKGWFGNR